MKKVLVALFALLVAGSAAFIVWYVIAQPNTTPTIVSSPGETGTTSTTTIPATTTTTTTTTSSVTLTPETWQIQGTGHTYEAGTNVVDNGSTLAYAFQYEAEAGSALAGMTKFYYNPTPGKDGWAGGIRVGDNDSTETTVAALSHFEPSANGVKAVCDQMNIKSCSASSAYYMRAGQAIPLKSEQKIRLFFEANDLSQGVNSVTEIFYLDSMDGYVGEDFNKGSATLCGGAGSMDYAPGGDCALSVAVAANAETGLSQARQFKIGYPTLDSSIWDESKGTFMVITGADRCGKTNDGLFYATWDAESWNVTKDTSSCATPLVPYAHGPVLVHLGDGRYKLYYEDIMSNVPNGRVKKPLRFITADATRTGDPAIVDFADWDSYKNAGEVSFLWPDGTKLTDAEESGIGDHFIYSPDGIESQVMYLNLGGYDNVDAPAASTGLGIALPVR
jgi:hypothetical protein